MIFLNFQLTKKRGLFVFAIGFILIIASFFVFNKIGDLRPVLLSPSEDLVEMLENYEVGEEVSFPLSIPEGFKIGVFAKNLGKARDLQVSPGGVLLVSDPVGDRVLALPDKNGDGRVDEEVEILTKLDSPHGLAFFHDKLFVAQLTKITRYAWDEKNLSAKFDKDLFTYPYNGGHGTRSVVIGESGKLFLTIGSSCNVCLEDHPWLAAVLVSDIDGKKPRLFAKGLRNSVFLKINPVSGQVWGTEMGRDLLGDDVPPEEINIITDEGDYGWPYCYDDRIHDGDFDSKNSKSCAPTILPIWKMQAHSAPLGLVFINSKQFDKNMQGDLLVSFHGSWNRSVPTGYKIVQLDVEGDKVVGQKDFITGFIQGSQALGRPVDLEFDGEGSLYISDDKAGAVYKLSKK